MQHEHREFLAGVRITTLWTLASRVLGLVRDMMIAALLGLSGSAVADAFLIALRIPNLFRRLFGEGALTASYLPVLAQRLEHDRALAWQLASVVFTQLALLLTAVVVVVELVLGGLWLFFAGDERMSLLLSLSAVMFPYMLLICVAAQVSATLNALGRFGLPAMVPALLNIVLIVGAAAVPWLTEQPITQAYVLAVCVLLGGALQLAVQWPLLARLGFRYDYQPAASRAALKRIIAALVPSIVGLAVTQINTLSDSLIAFALSSDAADPMPVAWLGGIVDYPMRQGAAASLYYGERLYQFPIGILGVAVATVVFPLLARHAARGDQAALGADMVLGLRLVVFLSVPASLGLILLAEPLSRLFFEHGRFTAEDAQRTARIIACYGTGVWAYCALPVIVRGYYALGKHATPVRVAMLAVGLNLLLDGTLVWFWAEAGLAIATAASATLQLVLLCYLLGRLGISLWRRELAGTALRSILATAAMGAAGLAALRFVETYPAAGRVAIVAVPLVVSAAVYLVVYRALGGRELGLLFRKHNVDSRPPAEG